MPNCECYCNECSHNEDGWCTHPNRMVIDENGECLYKEEVPIEAGDIE